MTGLSRAGVRWMKSAMEAKELWATLSTGLSGRFLTYPCTPVARGRETCLAEQVDPPRYGGMLAAAPIITTLTFLFVLALWFLMTRFSLMPSIGGALRDLARGAARGEPGSCWSVTGNLEPVLQWVIPFSC